MSEMTTAEAKSLRVGERVSYLGRPAEVMHVRPNGVTVGYWGTGPKAGQFVKHRVAARYLERA